MGTVTIMNNSVSMVARGPDLWRALALVKVTQGSQGQDR